MRDAGTGKAVGGGVVGGVAGEGSASEAGGFLEEDLVCLPSSGLTGGVVGGAGGALLRLERLGELDEKAAEMAAAFAFIFASAAFLCCSSSLIFSVRTPSL